MPQPADPRAQRQATPDLLADSIRDGHERTRRFRQESEKRQAELAAQERHQRERQARREALARQEDDATRAKIFARYLQAEEEARARAQAEVPPVPLTTERQDAELLAEQEAGRRALAKYAQRSEAAAAARERTRAKEE